LQVAANGSGSSGTAPAIVSGGFNSVLQGQLSIVQLNT
jgi:hypothetical protein